MNLHVCVESSFTFQNVREEVTEGETMLMSHLRPLLPCFRVEETARSEVGERGREAEGARIQHKNGSNSFVISNT